MQVRKNSLLCPNCRKLISRDEEICPYCRISHPGSWLKNNPLAQLLNGQEKIIPAIIVVNVVMYIASLLLSGRGVNFNMSPFSFLSPNGQALMVLGATGTVPVLGYGRWWTVVSANYLHGGLLHIIFNMIVLRQLGPLVISEYGRNRMLSIYTIGGIVGFILSVVAGVRFTIGASAAVCALMGAMIYYGKSRGGPYGQAIYSQIGGWVISIFIFGFLVPGINNWGHAGGIVSGVVLGYLLGYSERRKEKLGDKMLAWISILVTVGSLLLGFVSAGLLLMSG